MKAYIFPGQGAQFTGMGLPLYENSAAAKSLFEQANDILGFDITSIMFEGSVRRFKRNEGDTACDFFAFCYFSKKLRGRAFNRIWLQDIPLVSFQPWLQMAHFVLKMVETCFSTCAGDAKGM